jgi:hypothetical protein
MLSAAAAAAAGVAVVFAECSALQWNIELVRASLVIVVYLHVGYIAACKHDCSQLVQVAAFAKSHVDVKATVQPNVQCLG